MHEVLVNRLGGLSLPRKSVVRLTDRPDMTLDVYRGRKTTIQQQQQQLKFYNKVLFVMSKALSGELLSSWQTGLVRLCTVKILKFGTPQTIAIIVLKIEKFDVTLH